MQRFLALEQVSVVLASCQPFFRRTCLVMTARILLKPCSAYLFAIGAHGLRPIINKNTDTYTLLCKHKYAGDGIFLIARLKPNVHIYTVGLPSGGLLLPGIVRLGVRCLF